MLITSCLAFTRRGTFHRTSARVWLPESSRTLHAQSSHSPNRLKPTFRKSSATLLARSLSWNHQTGKCLDCQRPSEVRAVLGTAISRAGVRGTTVWMSLANLTAPREMQKRIAHSTYLQSQKIYRDVSKNALHPSLGR